MSTFVIAVDDPRADDVRALLESHLAFAHQHSPPEDVHALDTDALLDTAITFFSARRQRELIAIGALKELDDRHGELKSMHTAARERGRGAGTLMVEHLLDVARQRGYHRVSLETGTMDAFTSARRLYARSGFTPCAPFGDYTVSPNSVCMTLQLDACDDPGP